MTIKSMRFVDRHFGGLLCKLLAFFYKIYPRQAKLIETPTKILFLKFWGMGTILLATQLILSVKKQYPRASLSILTFTSNKELCQLLNIFDNIYDFQISSVPRSTIQLIKILSMLRKQKFDILFDLEFFARFSTIISSIVNAKLSIGFFTEILPWRAVLYHAKIPFNPNQYIAQTYLDMLDAISDKKISPINTIKKIVPQKCEVEKIQKLLIEHGIAPDNVVVVNVNVSPLCLLRRWPQQNFISIIEECIIRWDLGVVLIGSVEDRSYVEDTAAKVKVIGKLVNLAGKLTIAQLVALLSCAKLLITNDSGPLHIAYSVGCPTISFFGPETPLRYGPKGEKHIVFYKNLPCSPCLNIYQAKEAYCKDNKCLQAITPDEVKVALKNLLCPKK